MKRLLKILLPVVLALIVVISFSVPAFAATTADVTITATPTYIAMTNSLSSWAIGMVTESDSSTLWWDSDGSGVGTIPSGAFDDAEMAATVTNTGSVQEDITIHTHNFTGGVGWTIAGSVGANTIVLKGGKTGDASEAAMITLTTSPQAFISDLAAAGTKKWSLHMETGTFTDGALKTGTVTIDCAAG